MSSNPTTIIHLGPGPGWRKLEIGEIIGKTDLNWYSGQWQNPLITGHALSASDLVTWRVIAPVDGPQWRDLAAHEMLDSTDLYWSSGRNCWIPTAFFGIPVSKSMPEFGYRRWVGDAKTADVITQSGLYEDRLGRTVTVVEHYSGSQHPMLGTVNQPEPVQVHEGWWRTRGGQVISVSKIPKDHHLAGQYQWWDGNRTWMNDGRINTTESAIDLVKYLGPQLKPGWWEMRDGEQIQVFECKSDPPVQNCKFRWCGLTPAGEVLFWTDIGHTYFDASAEVTTKSDDLVKFLYPPDRDQIRSLNETLQMKHKAIQEMECDIIAKDQVIETQRTTIETQLRVIENQQNTLKHLMVKELKDVTGNTEPGKQAGPEPMESYETVRVCEGRWKTRGGEVKNIRPCEPSRGAYFVWSWTDGYMTFQDNGFHNSTQESVYDLVEYIGPIESEQSDKIQEPEDTIRHLQQSFNNLNANLNLSDQLPNLDLIVTKLTNPDNEQQQHIIIQGLLVVSQLVQKNLDHKNSTFAAPILLPHVSPLVAMCCRASDKITRLVNLLSGQIQVENDNISDAITDLAEYLILLLTYSKTMQGQVDINQIRTHE